jgi:hypothetical protein
MKNTIQTQLAERTAAVGREVVVQKMGYALKKRKQVNARIEALLSDPQLGLGTATYDYSYSNKEFLIALGRSVGVDGNAVAAEIARIGRERDRERSAFRAWVFVETGFKRKGEPIFALAVMEPRRRLQLSVELCLMERQHLIEQTSNLVGNHYQHSKGRLPLWGQITGYKLVVSDSEQILFDTDGQLIRSELFKQNNIATLSIK